MRHRSIELGSKDLYCVGRRDVIRIDTVLGEGYSILEVGDAGG